jgi:hypothetical protein
MNPLTPYLALGGALASCLAGASGYFYGVDAGKNKIEAQDAKALNEANARVAEAQDKIGVIALAEANGRVARTDTFREITRAVPQIIDRPVYRNICVDADGVRLLDRAADAANGRADSAKPPSGPAGIPEAAERR